MNNCLNIDPHLYGDTFYVICRFGFNSVLSPQKWSKLFSKFLLMKMTETSCVFTEEFFENSFPHQVFRFTRILFEMNCSALFYKHLRRNHRFLQNKYYLSSKKHARFSGLVRKHFASPCLFNENWTNVIVVNCIRFAFWYVKTFIYYECGLSFFNLVLILFHGSCFYIGTLYVHIFLNIN